MKKRFLPIGVFAFFVGFSFLLCSSLSTAGKPGDDLANKSNPGKSGYIIDRLTQIRNNQVTGKVDPVDYLNAQLQVEKLSGKKQGSPLNLDWIPIGPNNAAGRTRALIFDNKDLGCSTLYTGGVAGGIWKSTNLGLTWTQVNSQNNEVLRVTCMSQTPSGTIYVGTGETYCRTNGFIGTGLFRSDDGNIFTLVPGTQPSANDPASNWAYITKLACSSAGRIYAATNTGLMYSDNGNDWNTAIPGFAVDVKIGSDGTVAAAVNNAVYIAVGGNVNNFVNVSSGSATTLPSSKIGWIELAIAPSDPNVMYASLADSATKSLYNVYCSEDKGMSWRVVFPSNTNYSPLGTNGCYANTLAVYPEDPYRVLLGGDNMWFGQKFTSSGYYNWEEVSRSQTVTYDPGFVPVSHHAYIFRPNSHSQVVVATDNGISLGTISSLGFSFQQLIKNLMVSQFNSLAFSQSKVAVLGGGMNIGTQIIPGGNVLNEPMNGVQIDGGNGGTGGECAWSLINPNTIVYALSGAVAPQDPLVRSEDMGVTPSPTFLGTLPAAPVPPNFFSIYNWESFDYIYSQDSITYHATTKNVPADSTIIVFSDNAKFPLRYTTPVAIPIGDSVRVQDVIQSRFFLANVKDTAGVFMTKELLKFAKDPKWFKIAKVEGKDPISCLSVSNDLSVCWAGSQKGKLYRISNLQLANDSVTADVTSSMCIVSTQKLVNPLFSNRNVTSISIAPDNSTVLVTLGNYKNSDYVFLTTNGLDSLPVFHSVQGTLPTMPVYTSLFEMSNPNKVILGTDFGIFSTDNISASSPQWQYESNGIGNVPVVRLKQQTNQGTYYHRMHNYGIIYSATYGSGIFVDTTYYNPLGVNPISGSPLAANELRIYPNPTTENVNISYKLENNSDIDIAVYDMTGKVVFYTALGRRQIGNHTESIDLSSIPSGTFLIRLSYSSGNAFGKVMKVN